LSPEEIHKLASKTRKTVTEQDGKASCHSDLAGEDEAKELQSLPVV
jgi:phosphomethylpyrimidine synthase